MLSFPRCHGQRKVHAVVTVCVVFPWRMVQFVTQIPIVAKCIALHQSFFHLLKEEWHRWNKSWLGQLPGTWAVGEWGWESPEFLQKCYKPRGVAEGLDVSSCPFVPFMCILRMSADFITRDTALTAVWIILPFFPLPYWTDPVSDCYLLPLCLCCRNLSGYSLNFKYSRKRKSHLSHVP